jgi:hypothetical protein
MGYAGNWSPDHGELQQLVARLCEELGLPHFHFNDRRAPAGWPDSIIIGSRVLYRELKTGRGRRSPDQVYIGYRLQAAGADYDVWRERDWISGRIYRELKAVCLPLGRGTHLRDESPDGAVAW